MSAVRDIASAVEKSTRGGSAALEYRKGGHCTGEGDRYEERVLALVFLRCLRRGLLFQLSANNSDAGKFDDVVLVWRREGQHEVHTLFVQLKHKTSPRSMTIHSGTWLSEAPNCDFGFRKYFTSYVEISESLELDRVTVVLMTNACLGDSSLNMFERQGVGGAPGLELLQTGGSVHRLNPDSEQVGKAVGRASSFVERFHLLCEQRNSVGIVCDICEELEELLGAGDLCGYICDGLCKSIREWMNEESVCLTSGWSKWQALVDEYVRKEVTECRVLTTRLKYCSVEDVRGYVESCNPAWVRPPVRGTEPLSVTKVHQALADETHIMVAAEKFTELRHKILRCWGSFCRWLVIVDDDTEGACGILSELVTKIENERRLIIVSSRENNGFVDTCQSSDVSDGSWNECLDLSVRLNGERYECRLRDLVAGVDAIKSLLDGEPALLLALARLSQPLRMGQELETLPAYYIPRKLVARRLVKCTFFTSLGVGDVCVTDSASYKSLSRKILRHSVTSFAEAESWILNPSRFEWPLIVLTDELENTRGIIRSWAGLTIYALKVSDNGWKFLYFFGSADSIREFVQEQQRERIEALEASSSVVIVEGRPGVGKSKMLSHAAKRMKETDSGCWLLRVNLLEFYTVLDNSDKVATAVGDILKRTIFNKDELGRLEYTLLYHNLLHSPRVVSLVDGFDEVCPDYVNKCLEVLPLLAPRLGKLMVTTRPSPVRLLEARMGVLAHSLEPFTKLEQEKFFHDHPSRENIPTVSNFNRSTRDFLRIPLFAEMFANLSQEMGESCDIVTLYEAFFQNKFRRLYGEKWGDNLSAPGKKREVQEAQKRHEEQLMRLAESVLLHKRAVLAVPPFDGDYLVKSGIVYEFANGKPTFLHKTFAEHFLAKWCFLGDGVRSRVDVYRDAYLDMTLEFFRESFDRRAVRGRPLLEALLEAVLDDDEGMVTAVLAEGPDPRQTDACGRNALHMAVGHNASRSLSALLLCRGAAEGLLSAEDSSLGWTPMRYALEGGHSYVIEKLLEAGSGLNHLGDLVAVRHDSAKLVAVFEQRGYRTLYRRVFRVNNPSPLRGRTSEDVAVEIQFAASLISANVPKEWLILIAEKASANGNKIASNLLFATNC